MKFAFGLLLVVISFNLSRADGIEFFHGTWAETLAKSKETGKIIFMDAFTTWCGPCKRMSASTFTQKGVGDFYNANFINVKMDMEKGEGPTLAGTYNVTAYPTLLFIDGDGKLVQRVVGYQEPDPFINAGKGALKKSDKSDFYAKEYTGGKKDFTTIYNYVKALNQAGKPSLKIANEYINTQKDLTTPDNLRFLFEAATEVDSRLFDLMLNQKDKLTSMFSAAEVQAKIIAAAHKTVKKGIEYKTSDLLTTAQDKIRNLLPAESGIFNFESNLAFYAGVADAEGLYKAMKKIPSDLEKNSIRMNALSIQVETSFPSDTKLLGLCAQLLSKAITQEADPGHLFTLARLYALDKKNDKADKTIDQAISLAKSKNMDTTLIETFKQQIPKS